MTVLNTPAPRMARAPRMALATSRRPAGASRPSAGPEVASPPPATRTGRNRATAAPLAHDVDEASIGQCDCRKCLDERHRRQSHPLLAAALKALYDATDTLHRLARSHGCRVTGCSLCHHDVRLSLAVLDTLLCTLEGEFSFASDPQLARRRDESRVCQADTRRRSSRPWRPGCGTNHPLHELTVLILVDAGKALEALHRARACGAYVDDQAEVGAFLVPFLVAQIEDTLIPTPDYLRLRFPGRGRAQVLRLLEQADTLPVGSGR